MRHGKIEKSFLFSLPVLIKNLPALTQNYKARNLIYVPCSSKYMPYNFDEVPDDL